MKTEILDLTKDDVNQIKLNHRKLVLCFLLATILLGIATYYLFFDDLNFKFTLPEQYSPGHYFYAFFFVFNFTVFPYSFIQYFKAIGDTLKKVRVIGVVTHKEEKQLRKNNNKLYAVTIDDMEFIINRKVQFEAVAVGDTVALDQSKLYGLQLGFYKLSSDEIES